MTLETNNITEKNSCLIEKETVLIKVLELIDEAADGSVIINNPVQKSDESKVNELMRDLNYQTISSEKYLSLIESVDRITENCTLETRIQISQDLEKINSEQKSKLENRYSPDYNWLSIVNSVLVFVLFLFFVERILPEK